MDSHRQVKVYFVRVFIRILCLLRGLALAQDCYTPRWIPGHCTNLRACDPLLQLIQQYNQNGDAHLVTYLQNSICGYNGFDMMVCCPAPGSYTTSTVTTSAPLLFSSHATGQQSASTGVTFAPIVNQPGGGGGAAPVSPINPGFADKPQTFAPINFSPSTDFTSSSATMTTLPAAVFPSSYAPASGVGGGVQLPTFERDKCGMSNATHSRVVGGLPAQVNAWPWIALVGYRSAFDSVPRFLCGGTLITQKHVLTAAHCIKESLYMVRLGEHDTTTSSETLSYDLPVDLKVVHERFDPKTIHNDIALLRLAQAAPFTDTVRPICLPLSEELRNRDYTYYQPFLAGWGATQYRGIQATVLQEVQLPIQPLADCEAAYKVHFPEQVFDSAVLCAGYMQGGKDSCQGDSGSGLMLPQLSQDQSYYYFNLLGIVSYGYECARPGFPGIYTRVTTFIPWIMQHIND